MQKQRTTRAIPGAFYSDLVREKQKSVPIRTNVRARSYTMWVTIITCITLCAASIIYLWYYHVSNDVAPDSLFGLAYAWIALGCMIAALTLYAWHRRRVRKRIGSLNKSLQWHISLGAMSVVLALMHSFNNLNMRTGTYALYALIALVISGILGKVIDRYASRLIAIEARKTLTQDGDGQLPFVPQHVHGGSRNLNYSRSRTTEKLAELLLYEYEQTHSPLVYTMLEELQETRRSMRREYFYRVLIHVWRRVHIALALLTVALICWHIVFALSLWMH